MLDYMSWKDIPAISCIENELLSYDQDMSDAISYTWDKSK